MDLDTQWFLDPIRVVSFMNLKNRNLLYPQAYYSIIPAMYVFHIYNIFWVVPVRNRTLNIIAGGCHRSTKLTYAAAELLGILPIIEVAL